MWKKSAAAAATTPTPTANIKPVAVPVKNATNQKARIGAGLKLKGELSGKEDVIIEGSIEGKVTLKGQSVVIEKSGRVDGDVFANHISVAGEVHGNLYGTTQVVLLEAGRVEGDVLAKSVTIETGAQFKGSIDMKSVETMPARAAQSKTATSDEKKEANKPNGVAQPVSAS